MRLTLARKMLLGNLLLVLLILVVGLSALASLKAVHALGTNLVQVDLPNLELAAQLSEVLTTQDQYEQRFIHIGDRALRAMADEQADKFRRTWRQFGALPHAAAANLIQIKDQHAEYGRASVQARAALERGETLVAEALWDELSSAPRRRLTASIQALAQTLKGAQWDALQESQGLIRRALIMTLVTCGVGLVFGVTFALTFSRSLARSLGHFKTATQMIGKGLYDDLLPLKGSDEVGDLAESFRWMSHRLKELEETNLDANPLTRLPGNLAIEKSLLIRLQRQRRFAFCHIDLDNFKAFGDRYGYARGSEVLKMVSRILVRLTEGGSREMFIGHIGGDDFVLICGPERASGLCQQIIKEFDSAIPDFYDAEDREKGFIISQDRNEVIQQFPIMTISIAVVTNERREISTPMQVAEVAAQLKKYAKGFPKSIFVIDQRRET
ncbi:MAG: sensor domain-containing diguanylate cyclase [Nitrospiria bacterium]